jgi:pseudouridine-5'-phosphate glycosidase
LGTLHISPEIAQALKEGTPVVALESALITHGFAPPGNLDIARRMEATVRTEGALPATLAILDGEVHVGLSDEALIRLAADRSARKVSLRDIPVLLAQGASGGTTVAATMALAHRASIRVFCTGGIGGVHRGHPEDISADLTALASTPLVTVCAGAKAILDLPRTLEVLETHGVPVIGYGTDEFPAFYSRRSGLGVDARAETPDQVARIVQAQAAMDLQTALLVCVPVPEADELPAPEAETAIAQALAEAEAQSISGRAITPFMLARMVELTGGRARRANEALLLNNARTAARIARALT